MIRNPRMATKDDQTRRFAEPGWAWARNYRSDSPETLQDAIETLREAILGCQPVDQVAIRLLDLAKIEAFLLGGWRG